MAKHNVKFTLPERELGKADIKFTVKKDGKAFGKLKVSNGSIVWVRKEKTYGHQMTWTEFDDKMKDFGKPEKK